jgi:type II secretory ATPase GspE/PulE/Tfp pilus assembly ATPase PilB-like protein
MKVEPFLLVSTLNIVIAQRLVRMLAGSKTKYFLNKEELDSLEKIVSLDRMLDFLHEEKIVAKKDSWDKVPFWKPNPGKDTEDGYANRIGIHEILKVTPTVKDLIMKGATSADIEKQAKQEGMMTMLEDGIFKAAQGITTIEEVLRVISE